METLGRYLNPIELPLSHIHLDPNNPRFVGSNWSYVPPDKTADPSVQERTMEKLVSEYEIDKLKLNMETNGYLPIDRVIVQKLAEDEYVVLEGNRRIAAAKSIQQYATDGTLIPQDVLDSLKHIPCLEYVGSERSAAWIFQGLRHISGISDWSAFNKAKLLVEQMTDEDLSLKDIGKKFGLSAYGAGQWARGYFAFRQAKEQTEYSNEIDERIYPYFQELFGRSSIAIKDWLGWDDDQKEFKRVDNLNEFTSWFYPKGDPSDSEPDTTGVLGSWERRRIGKRDDIRQLAHLVQNAPLEFQKFRQGQELETSYGNAVVEKLEQKRREETNPPEAVFQSLEEAIKSLENIPLKVVKDHVLKSKFDQLAARLESALSYARQ